MNFIKKIFDGISDEQVHLQFQKFSRGEFRDRAIIKAKHSAKKYTLSTSAEFANELVRFSSEKLGKNKTKVSGAIVSTLDLTGEFNFKDKKQFQGVKRYIIDGEMSGEEILSLLEKFPKAFFALSLEVPSEGIKLKIKPKAPKSGKPGTKGEEEPKADFCKLVFTDSAIAKEFIFEVDNFKDAFIKHHFFIESIIIPEELKKEKDFAKIRELSKRKGKVVREAVIDGKEIKSEKEFIA